MTSIAFIVNEVAGGWSPNSTRLGGTEESVVRWARELSDRGDWVTVYHNGEHGIYDGVEYLPRESYRGAEKTINVKSSDIVPIGETWYLTNEVDADKLDLSAYRSVILPSQWAKDNIPVNNKVDILPHGYDSNAIYPHKKSPLQCLYASSPDRGLDTLKEVWPRIVEKHPNAQLVVTYGGHIDTPNTVCLDNVPEELMNSLYNHSEFWLHPCTGGELYCISGIKAQAAACIPVIKPVMALQETVRDGFFCYDDDYFSTIDEALSASQGRKFDIMRNLAGEHFPSWSDTTDILSKIIGV